MRTPDLERGANGVFARRAAGVVLVGGWKGGWNEPFIEAVPVPPNVAILSVRSNVAVVDVTVIAYVAGSMVNVSRPPTPPLGSPNPTLGE